MRFPNAAEVAVCIGARLKSCPDTKQKTPYCRTEHAAEKVGRGMKLCPSAAKAVAVFNRYVRAEARTLQRKSCPDTKQKIVASLTWTDLGDAVSKGRLHTWSEGWSGSAGF